MMMLSPGFSHIGLVKKTGFSVASNDLYGFLSLKCAPIHERLTCRHKCPSVRNVYIVLRLSLFTKRKNNEKKSNLS